MFLSFYFCYSYYCYACFNDLLPLCYKARITTERSIKNMSELNFSWKCEESRTDELGVLAHSLNEMSKKLSAALENLQAANIKLQADIEHEKN